MHELEAFSLKASGTPLYGLGEGRRLSLPGAQTLHACCVRERRQRNRSQVALPGPSV